MNAEFKRMRQVCATTGYLQVTGNTRIYLTSRIASRCDHVSMFVP